jgi:hypothetical protein
MYCNVFTVIISTFDQVVKFTRGCRDHMVFGFTTTHAISAYHHYSCEFESGSLQGVLYTTLCDKVCQWLTAGGQWFSPGTLYNFMW